MTQLWPEGLPIVVEAVDGQPVALHWRERRHAVRAIVDQWIIHDEWWRATDSEHPGEIWRHYFQVQTANGLLCVVYRDLLRNAWRLERAYD